MAQDFLSSKASDALNRLRTLLVSQRQLVDVSEADEPRVRRAIEWLLANNNPSGYWGYRSPAVTATCVIAMLEWRPSMADTVKPAIDWLLTQAPDGEWETVWDTAVCVRAACLAGEGQRSEVRRGLERLCTLDPEAHMWRARPHHAAQVALTLNAVSDRASHVLGWRKTLSQLGLTSTPYVGGQVACAILHTGGDAQAAAIHLEQAAAYLKKTKETSTAAFLDHASALQALALSGQHVEIVARTVDLIFRDSFRRDGSWYHEPWYTAWALLALYRARSVSRVIMDVPGFNSAFSSAERDIEKLRHVECQRAIAEWRNRWVTVAGMITLFLSIVGIFGTFVLPVTHRIIANGVLAASVFALLPGAISLLYPRLRRPES